MNIEFIKMHGIGNDFLIFDNRVQKIPFTDSQIKALSDRNKGIGFDQMIVLENTDKADVFMRIYNIDGSEAEACGNATRCVASLMMDSLAKETVEIETVAGILYADKAGDLFKINMGSPRLNWQEIPLSKEYDTADMPVLLEGLEPPICVNIGNPHAVFFVDNLEDIDLEKQGRHIENNELFPEKTNVEFAKIIDRDNIRMQVWERGSGITIACGSAACATHVAAVRKGLVNDKTNLILDGGVLEIEWDQKLNKIYMTGAVKIVYKGVLDKNFFD